MSGGKAVRLFVLRAHTKDGEAEQLELHIGGLPTRAGSKLD